MGFKTIEQRFLADYEALELESESLKEKIEALEIEVAQLHERLRRMEIERDHHADCVKDMLAVAKWHGFDQPQCVAMNPAGGVECGSMA